MCTFNFSDGKLCPDLLPWWKNFFILYVQKNYYRNMALFPCSFVATSFWMGKLCARAFGSRVGTNLFVVVTVCILTSYTLQLNIHDPKTREKAQTVFVPKDGSRTSFFTVRFSMLSQLHWLICKILPYSKTLNETLGFSFS